MGDRSARRAPVWWEEPRADVVRRWRTCSECTCLAGRGGSSATPHVKGVEPENSRISFQVFPIRLTCANRVINLLYGSADIRVSRRPALFRGPDRHPPGFQVRVSPGLATSRAKPQQLYRGREVGYPRASAEKLAEAVRRCRRRCVPFGDRNCFFRARYFQTLTCSRVRVPASLFVCRGVEAVAPKPQSLAERLATE